MRCARSAISRPLILLAGLLAGCGVVRPSDYSPICPSYEVTLRPVVEARCAQCHSATRAEGGYRVGAHTDTVSRSDDGTPRVAPGDPNSPFLTAVRGERAGHNAIPAEDARVLEDWVVRCRAAPRPYEFHPRGWTTPTDPEQFHGLALRAKSYDVVECQKCHGDDLRGGASRVDCNTCHVEGPQACNTCHGDKDSFAPPRDLKGARATTGLGVGAHRAHVTASPTHRALDCTDCHAEVKDDRHYRRPDVFLVPAPLQLTSGPTGTAKWDRPKATCTNVYCHAPAAGDTAPSRSDPVWTRAGITCGSCHGAPPSSHASTASCEICHGAGYADGGVDLALHLDGKVALRNGGIACDACHSGPDSPVFLDLKGVRPSDAHDAHLRANRLRGPMACSECHVVPQTLLTPGHLDSPPPAEVFAIDLGGLAWKFGAAPVYNAANGTCGSVYCHGAGQFGPPDTAPGLLRTPSWRGASDQAACGTCHGLPPKDGTLGHNAAITINCSVCHSGSVMADGGILFTSLPDGGLTSKHLDGKITGQ